MNSIGLELATESTKPVKRLVLAIMVFSWPTLLFFPGLGFIVSAANRFYVGLASAEGGDNQYVVSALQEAAQRFWIGLPLLLIGTAGYTYLLPKYLRSVKKDQ